jgi:hypothetical protein
MKLFSKKKKISFSSEAELYQTGPLFYMQGH